MFLRRNQAALLLSLLSLSSTSALASVSPEFVDIELLPGESLDIVKTVTLPAATPKLDLLLLVDLSGSYGDDLPNIKGVAEDLADTIRADIPDSRFGLATFVDFPFIPWGYAPSGDYAYQLDQDLTTDIALWSSAVQGMTISYGYDVPESQYEGLYQAVTGEGREMPVSFDGDYDDLGEIAPGLNASFRPDATRVIAITTDAIFHEGGDLGGSFPYPGATASETLDALLLHGVKVIAIKAPGAGAEMDELASETGGSVVTSTSSSSNIAAAILDGLDELTYTVSALPRESCDALDLDYTPGTYLEVAGGESRAFTETVGVPLDISEEDLDEDGTLTCLVDFLADDTIVGTQTLTVYVPLNTPPVALCQDLTLIAGDACLAEGDVDAGSHDPDGDPITFEYSDTGPYTLGSHTVTLTVTDDSGAAASCSALVTVTDDTPPQILLGGGFELWPPNHKYQELDLEDCGLTVIDACDGELELSSVANVESIYSDEPEDLTGNGDGRTLEDILLLDDLGFALRAERQGAGNGRVYGVLFSVSDGSGNASEGTCLVSVPHSQNGVPAVNDGSGAGYTVD